VAVTDSARPFLAEVRGAKAQARDDQQK